MKLKEKYREIDFIKKMDKRIDALYNKGIIEKSKTDGLKKYYEGIEKLKQNNWFDTYCVLSLLAGAIPDIKLNMCSTSEGMLSGTMYVYAIWIWFGDNGEYVGERPLTTFSKKNANGLSDEQVIVEVGTADIEKVEEVLDSICDGWQETIILRVKNTEK